VALATGLLRLRTEAELAIVDITEGVQRVIAGSGVSDGVVCVFVRGSTAAVTTMEYEPGGVADLREALERLVPRERPGGGDYAHNVRNHDDNAHSHLRATLLGPSETIPLVGGQLVLGTWQQLVLIELDDRPREREVHVQIAS
jgi:secondary thiamine-phosphate synthase enzyme